MNALQTCLGSGTTLVLMIAVTVYHPPSVPRTPAPQHGTTILRSSWREALKTTLYALFTYKREVATPLWLV